MPRERSSARWIVPVALFGAVAATYLLTIPGNRSEAEDAFFYAKRVEASNLPWHRYLHSNHMLYFPLMRLYRSALETAGASGRSYDQLVLLDLLVGAAAIVLFHLLLRKRLAVDLGPALVGSLLLAFSYGFWRYSVEVEIPVWTNLFALLLLYLAFAPIRTAVGVFALGVAAGSALLMHGLNSLLACAVVPIRLVLTQPWRRVPLYALGAALLLVPSYGVPRYALSGSSPDATMSTASGLAWTTLPKGLIGLGQCIASGNFLWGSAWLSERIAALFPDKMLAEEMLMGRAAPGWLFALSTGSFVLLGVAAAWVLVARLRLGRAEPAPPAGRYFVWWALVFATFALPRNPGSFELWVPALVPIWTIVTLYGVQPLHRAGHGLPCIALVAALFLHNLVGGFAWIRSADSDYNAVRGAWLIEHATARDLIITADTTAYSKFVRYGTPARMVNTFGLAPAELAELGERIRRTPGKVYVVDDVFSPARCLCLRRPEYCKHLAAFGETIRPTASPIEGTGPVTIYTLSVTRSPGSG